MSNEKLARQWAERIKAAPDETYVDDVVAAAEHIMATTDPLTMADVEWNDEKHYLAGAVFEAEGSTCPVVMIGETLDSLGIYSVDLDENTGFWPSQEDLTPNGKRYELREIGAPEQPAHPETLVTQADYENAPVGTIVEEPGGWAWRKGYDGEWYSRSQGGTWRTIREMADTERQVLRWGWGK